MKKILMGKITRVMVHERGSMEDTLTEIFCALGEMADSLAKIEETVDHCCRDYDSSNTTFALQKAGDLSRTALFTLREDLSFIDKQLSLLEISLEFIELLRKNLKTVEEGK